MNAEIDEDLALLSHLDWEPTVPCSFHDIDRGEQCFETATWLGVCKNECGASSACCDEHRLWLLSSRRVFRCKRCRVEGAGIEVLRFVSIRQKQ